MGSMDPTDDFHDRPAVDAGADDLPDQDPQEAAQEAQAALESLQERREHPEDHQDPPLPDEPVSRAGVDLVDQISPRLRRAVLAAQVAVGEQIDYVVAPGLIPNAQGQGISVMTLSLFVSGGPLGAKVHGTAMIENFYASQEDCDALAASMAGYLIEQRSQQVSAMDAEVQAKAGAVDGLISGSPAS